jgi:hypothetical protein
MAKPNCPLGLGDSITRTVDNDPGDRMNAKRDLEPDKHPAPTPFGRWTMIFIILFAVACYFLVWSMMRHHFLGGGRDNLQSQH